MTGTVRAAIAALASTGAHLALAGGLVALSRAGSLPSIVVDLSTPALEAPAPSVPARVAPPAVPRVTPRASRAPAPVATPPAAPHPEPAGSVAPPPMAAEPRREPASAAIEAPAAAPSMPAPAPAVLPALPSSARDSSGSPAASIAGPPAGSASGPRGGGEPSSPSGPATAVARPGESRVGPPPEYAGYLARFRHGVQAGLTYPMAARRRGIAGTVELEVSIDPQGRVRDVRVSTSSSHAILDDAAADAVRRLPPMPFPAGLPPRALTVRLPLVFALQ